MLTHTRVKKSDCERIKKYTKEFNCESRTSRSAQHDVITMALDALDEKIIKTNDKSMKNNGLK